MKLSYKSKRLEAFQILDHSDKTMDDAVEFIKTNYVGADILAERFPYDNGFCFHILPMNARPRDKWMVFATKGQWLLVPASKHSLVVLDDKYVNKMWNKHHSSNDERNALITAIAEMIYADDAWDKEPLAGHILELVEVKLGLRDE